MKQICSDLDDQYGDFDTLIAGIDENQWHAKTPFFNWSIFDEVAHIAFFDHEALLAITDRNRFRIRAKDVMEVIISDGSWPDYTNALLGYETPSELLASWRDIRSRLLQQLRAMKPNNRIPWYGPDMSARSFATARLMETWAHSQDVFDALRIKRVNSDRLRHVAHIGVTTFRWSFIVRELPPPELNPHVELIGPTGNLWKWGNDDEKTEWVRGKAEDFCLVVTQRRNIADTELKWQGKNVSKWLTIAQAFAGVPQDSPEAGKRRIEYFEDTLKTAEGN